MTRLTTRAGTRTIMPFVAMFVVALGLCLMQGLAILAFRDPQPTVSARLGEWVEVAGARYRLDEFTVARDLAAKPGEGPLLAMDGALLVRAVITIEVVEPAKNVDELYCTFGLIDDRRRTWTADFDVNYLAAGPDRVTCANSETNPVEAGTPYAVGNAFTIPADAGPSVKLRLELPTDRELIEFSR
jgi:hypothetical protein